MSRLSEELRKDPGAVFEIEADLPSGNRMMGTFGPMVGTNVVGNVRFRSYPSEADIAMAREVMNQMMGSAPEMTQISRTPEEHAEAARVARKFLGGGQG